MNKYLIFFCFTALSLSAQKKVAITIDDVPNVWIKEKSDSKFLKLLDSLDIPVAIFINEGHLNKTETFAENLTLLENWIRKPYVTTGNHTFNHLHYSESTLENYKEEVIKGEEHTRRLSDKHRKKLEYFRFPFNDLGADSLQHAQILAFLQSKKYINTPFSVESSDWMFNGLYEHYLKKGDLVSARRVADKYVSHTLEQFSFFEKISEELYGRQISHIYLCHDNRLNTDYLSQITRTLQNRNYTFVSLKESLKDKIYNSKDHFKGKWGFSWVYRWIKEPAERSRLMKREPSIAEIEKEFEGMR